MINLAKWSVTGAAACIVSVSLAQSLNLPLRQGARPLTTDGVPHVQIELEGNADISAELSRRVSKFPGVTLGPTRVSLPGAIGFQLSRDIPLARPEVIVGGLEFAHLHPDGSLHASLDPILAREAIEAGWAISHPWSSRNPGWEGFVMIYSPVSNAQLDIVTQLLQQSYTYVTGQTIVN